MISDKPINGAAGALTWVKLRIIILKNDVGDIELLKYRGLGYKGHSKSIHCFPFPSRLLFVCRNIQFIIYINFINYCN